MGIPLVEIKGFKQFQSLLKKLPDNVKKRELNKILGQVANPTLKAAIDLAPVGSGEIVFKDGKTYKRGKRQVRKKVYQNQYTPGLAKNSIAKKAMTKTKNAVVSVSPRSRKKADGFYLRQFVIPGTKHIKANSFIDEAYKKTKGKVTADAEKQVTRYLQKRIDSLIK